MSQSQKASHHRLRVEDLKVVPPRRIGLWVSTVVVLLFLGLLGWAIGTNQAFGWPIVGKYLFHPSILKGLGNTLLLTVTIMVFATIIGTIIAIMRLSPSRILQVFANAYIWFFRGAPALIQLIFWFNLAIIMPQITLSLPGLGTLFSVRTNDVMTPFLTAVVALSLHEAGYMAEIIRAGITSVPPGQTEAASTLGMSRGKILRRIVLPQAMRFIVPPTGNEAINLMKATSLVTVIAVDDLLYSAQTIYARTFETIPLLIVVAFWYLAMVTIMSIGQHFLETHFNRSDSRGGGGFTAALRRAFSFSRGARA